MQQTITETATTLQATPIADKPGELLVTLITPGQGSSGFYSAECLEAAGTDKVFPAGTQMFLDHPTESEQYERPERSVKDLGAVLTEDASWNGTALVAPAKPFSQHKELLTEMQEFIGVSIRASAEVEEAGAGRQIKRLVQAESVDFVTRAGRGGSFQVLESVRPGRVNERAIRHGVREATVNDQREALQNLLKDAYGAERTWVWIRDFDATTVWFEIESDDDMATYEQTYSTGDNGFADALTGDRQEVQQVTKFVPVDPAGQSTTQESQGGHMEPTKVTEAEISDLREKAGRVPALEAERDTAVKERDEVKEAFDAFKADLAIQSDADEVITKVATESEITFDELQIAGLKANLPITENALDTEKFTETVEAAATKVAETKKSGTITGFGPSTIPADQIVGEADFDSAVAEAFGRPLTTVQEG